MDPTQVSIDNMGRVCIMCCSHIDGCVLDWQWVDEHLYDFHGGYHTILAHCQYDTFTSMQWFKVDNLPSGIDALLDSSWMKEYCQYVERYTQMNEVHNLIPAWNEKMPMIV